MNTIEGRGSAKNLIMLQQVVRQTNVVMRAEARER